MTRRRWWPAPVVALGAVAAGTALSTAALVGASWLVLGDDLLLDVGGVQRIAETTTALTAVLRWTVTVTIWSAVLWVATVRQARRGRSWLPLTLAMLAVPAWTTLAAAFGGYGWWLPQWFVDAVSGAGGWYSFPWLGPLPAVAWHHERTTVAPGIGVPLLLVATLVVVAVRARRHASRTSALAPLETAASRAVASIVVAVPAAALWLVSATYLLADPTSSADTTAVGYVNLAWGSEGVARPAALFATGLVLVAAALVSGSGRATLVLVPAQLWAAWPLVGLWWGGAPYGFAAAAVLTTLATAMVALRTPLSRFVARVNDETPVTWEVTGHAATRPTVG